MAAERVHMREVVPRDGLQLAKTVLSTADKLAWCYAALLPGVAEVEATSFVPPHVSPEFVDADAVAGGALDLGRPDRIPVLVVNLKGAIRAFAGLSKANDVVSASEDFPAGERRGALVVTLAGPEPNHRLREGAWRCRFSQACGSWP